MATSARSEASSRERILAAASEITRAGGRASVRIVADRAGVGLGTLRHHFPTQRALLDAVLASIYDESAPDDRIRDDSLPAADRLVYCLGGLLSDVGLDDHARESWAGIFRTYIDPGARPEVRRGYRELHRHVSRRIESWLAILSDDGAIVPGDNAVRAQLLLTVVNGLALQRALPSDESPLERETQVLRAAVTGLQLQDSDARGGVASAGPPG